MDALLVALLGLIAAERLGELVLSRRNQRRLLARGGQLVDADGYTALVAVHVLWFPAILAGHVLAPWAGRWAGTWPLLALYGLAEGLRWWAITTLGERWTTRVVVLPGEEPVREGPYRWLAHPNYLAVAVELAVLPLAFGLPGIAAAWTVANGLALRRRIATETAALEAARQAGTPLGP